MDAETQHKRLETRIEQRSGLRARMQFARWLIVVALIVLLGALLFSRIHRADQAIAQVQRVSASSVRPGQLAPDFTFSPVSGASAQAVSLSKLRGHVVVINFWSPSCAPCQDEAPILSRVARQFALRGVVFLGVAFDGTRDDILNFIRRFNVPYACGTDETNMIAVAYGLVAIPVTVVVNRQGIVRQMTQGVVSQDNLDRALQQALSQHT